MPRTAWSSGTRPRSLASCSVTLRAPVLLWRPSRAQPRNPLRPRRACLLSLSVAAQSPRLPGDGLSPRVAGAARVRLQAARGRPAPPRDQAPRRRLRTSRRLGRPNFRVPGIDLYRNWAGGSVVDPVAGPRCNDGERATTRARGRPPRPTSVRHEARGRRSAARREQRRRACVEASAAMLMERRDSRRRGHIFRPIGAFVDGAECAQKDAPDSSSVARGRARTP